MDESVYSLLVFNNVFGSGMSSRLFQNIREQRGLVYSISAGHSAYINTGVFDISAGMSPESLGEVAHLISKEINTIKHNKLTSAEITKAKELAYEAAEISDGELYGYQDTSGTCHF